ncbi:WD40 repeat domain-containing protein [Chloroflexota bacterium]
MYSHAKVNTVLIFILFLITGCGRTEPAAPSSTPETVVPTITPTTIPISNNQIISSENATQLKTVATLDLPESFVNTIIFSPDSRTMITADRNGEVLLWERGTWEAATFLPAQSSYAADSEAQIWFWGTLALSPDGNLIINAYGDDGVVTGRKLDGQTVFSISFGARVYSIALSPDGKLLAVGGLKNNVIIFNLETQQQVEDLVSEYEYIMNLDFSPDGKTLLASYERPQNVIITWGTDTWQETATFPHTAERTDYHDVLFSPDGLELVIATIEQEEIIFLNIATKEITKELTEHNRAAYQIAFSPDGNLLASAGDDGMFRIWDANTGESLKVFYIDQEIGAVAFSPDGSLIAISIWTEGVIVWDIPRE